PYTHSHDKARTHPYSSTDPITDSHPATHSSATTAHPNSGGYPHLYSDSTHLRPGYLKHPSAPLYPLDPRDPFQRKDCRRSAFPRQREQIGAKGS
ncbi:hypothetical protein NW840_05955, partial [Synechococcus sp. R5-13]